MNQLRELRLQLRDELDRHTKAMQALDRQLALLLGDIKPRPKLTELRSPDGKSARIKSRPI